MTSQTAFTYDLFVSHADDDRAWVEGYLLDALAAAGVRCTSEAAFALGMPRLLEFERAVQGSRRTVLVLSPAYMADGYDQFANVLAQSYGVEHDTWPVIALVLHPVDLPPRLAMLTGLDATDPANHAAVVARLCAEVARPAPGPAPPPPCPYPGIRPFREEQSDRFFGRDEEVQDLVRRLRRHPFLTVIGPSGSGKSSLVFAGLLPALRGSTLFGEGAWAVRSLRPGPTPLAELERVLGGETVDAAALVARLLAEQPGATRLLVIVDQFEETFAVAGPEATAFQEALLRLTQAPGCWIVLTVRADFYPELMASPLWPAVQAHRTEVLPLDDAGLREAIVRPAEAVGVYVEAALVERLVADAAGEPGSLPLVQETLVLLWQHLKRRFLPLHAYESLVNSYQADQPAGGPRRTALQVAMAEQADQTLAELSPDQQAIARRVFLRLVQFGEGRADTRRRQLVDQLAATSDDRKLLATTIQALANRRLLTVGGEERLADRAVDIAHEALISGWPTLGHWLTERREAEQTRRRLEEKAEEWARLGRGAGGLLDAVELQEAERWLERPDAEALGYDATLTELLTASRTALDADEREREAARQRVIDAQRLRTEEQTRAATRFRRLALLMAVVAVAAVGAAALAVTSWQLAEQRRLSSIAQALAAEAPVQQRELNEHERAALLARQAYRFNKDAGGQMIAPVDAGLRAVLGVPFFGAVLTGERQGGRVVALSSDGLAVATGGADGSVWIRRLNEWRNGPKVLAGNGVEATALVLGEDGRWLVATDSALHVWRWDLAQLAQDNPTPVLVTTLDADTVATALSQDGQRLASKDSDGTIRLWNLAQPATPPVSVAGAGQLSPGASRLPRALAFSPDGRWLATTNRDGQVSLRATDRLEDAPLVLGGKPGRLETMAFSPDSRQLAAGGEDGRVWWWTALEPAAEARQMSGGGEHVWAVAFSRDGRWLAAGSEDWRVRLWTLAAPEAEPIYLTGHMRRVKALAFTADSQTLASASADEMVRLWQLGEPAASPSILAIVAGLKDDGFKALAFSPTAKLLAAGNQDWSVRVWDLDRPRDPPVVLGGRAQAGNAPGQASSGPRWVWTVAFSPDGRWLASGSQDGMIRIWEVAALRQPNPTPPRELSDKTGPVRSLSFSRDNRWLASGSGDANSDGQDNPVLLWALDGGNQKPAFRLSGHSKAVESVAFSPSDAELLAWASQDGTVRLWRLGSGGSAPRQVAVLDRLEPGTRTLAFSPDGRVLASGSGQTEAAGLQAGVVHLWTIGQADAAPVERGHLDVLGGGVHALTFSPTDSNQLATSSVDGTVRLWRLDRPDVSPVALHGHERLVRAIAYMANGMLLASGGSDDNTIRLWPTTERLAELACDRVRRNLSQEEWHRFIGADIAYQRTCDTYPVGEAAGGQERRG